MLTVTISDLKSDIASKMKGTSIRQVADSFNEICHSAANRMLTRIDTEETRRTQTLGIPFYDQLNDYPLPSDFKRMIDIRPTANRQGLPGLSDFSQTTPRQFDERLDDNSFSIGWNNFSRSLRAQRLPAGNVATLDSFESATSNGSWGEAGDASTITTENLNYLEGSGALRFNLSGATGSGNIVNSTAQAIDLSALLYNDASLLRFYIPSGYSSRFTSIKLLRGESAEAYHEATVTTQADGTAFQDGWNLLLFSWATSTSSGSPTNLSNTYRKLTIGYSTGAAITGVIVDYWTNALGNLYEIEYYSEYLFRSSAGTWLAKPTADTDLLNVNISSYEILKTEIMVDVTQIVRTGAVRAAELNDWRMMLNGQPPNRYVREPQYRGLYSDYLNKFPSSGTTTRTNYYDFDV